MRRRSTFWRRLLLGGVVLAMLTAGFSASAETWYVDSRTGADSNDGRAASPSAPGGPFRTLRRAVSALAAGDTLVMACGGSWGEFVELNVGTPNAPVRVVAAGECSADQLPRIDPRQALGVVSGRGWVETDVPAARVGAVFVGDTHLRPAVVGGQPWLRLPEQLGGKSQGTRVAIPPAALAHGGALIGAVLAVKTTSYRVERRTIVRVLQGFGVELDSATDYPAPSGAPFFIERIHLPSLEGWAADGRGRLAVHVAATARPVTWVERRPAFLARGTVRIEGLIIENAGAEAIRIEKGPASRIHNVEIRGAVLDGVSLSDSPNSTLEEMKILDVGRDAIRLGRSDGSLVVGNLIERVGMGALPSDTFAAINSETSSKVRIARNVIRSVAYLGIRFKRESVVQENLLTGICLRIGDCGAIYGWARLDPQVPFGSSIVRNVIRDVGSGESLHTLGSPVAAGIYLDDLSSGVTVTENTIDRAMQGVFLHNSTMNIVRKNTVFNVRDCAMCLVAGLSSETATRMGSNYFQDNALVPGPGGVGYRMFSRFGAPEWKRFSGDKISHAAFSRAVVIESGGRFAQLERVLQAALPDGSNDSPAQFIRGTKAYATSLSNKGTHSVRSLSWGLSRDAGNDQKKSETQCGAALCGVLAGGGRLYSSEFAEIGEVAPTLDFYLKGNGNEESNVRIELRSSREPYELLAEMGRLAIESGSERRVLISAPQLQISAPWRVHFVAAGPTNVAVRDFRVHFDAKSVFNAELVVNVSDVVRNYHCADLGGLNCTTLNYLDGQAVSFPIEMQPFSSHVLIKQ